MTGTWQPHKRETWPFQFATVKKHTCLREWVEHRRDPTTGEPQFIERWIQPGTAVRIVMVSRLGDVGITDRLEVEHGYLARVALADLTPATRPAGAAV